MNNSVLIYCIKGVKIFIIHKCRLSCHSAKTFVLNNGETDSIFSVKRFLPNVFNSSPNDNDRAKKSRQRNTKCDHRIMKKKMKKKTAVSFSQSFYGNARAKN